MYDPRRRHISIFISCLPSIRLLRCIRWSLCRTHAKSEGIHFETSLNMALKHCYSEVLYNQKDQHILTHCHVVVGDDHNRYWRLLGRTRNSFYDEIIASTTDIYGDILTPHLP